MSDETLKSVIDQHSYLSESATSITDNVKNETEIENPASLTEEQDAPIQDTECKILYQTESEILEMPIKEINQTVVEDVKDVDSEISLVEKEEKDSVTIIKQNEQSPNVQQTSIGAGDTCFAFSPRQNENNDVQKVEEKISFISEIEQIKLEDEQHDTNENELTILKLKDEVSKVSIERDSYQKQFESMEKKLTELQSSYDTLLKGEGNEAMLRRMVDQLKSKLIQTSLQLEDRIRTVANQEKQISALNSQVASLKEVESLTRSLLQIRNMEVKHLQAEVDDMEARISEERERYNTMINKMDAAVKLNADLKKEYETQLCLFRDLREKYEEKVSLLSEEKRALEANVQTDSK
ncbi:tropomyosin isoforms a/b/d/f [Apis florea]|uniref:tropomyosin isoforms a/b/d/f n=1 Tax=Apis florea TaxID=7463 RepID=UPI000252C45C|nr:tropomyosin isoforms a/b/d/f [Apis florea]XP_031775268.1 tropomyosin isoforms a/b/d/f [Apis florea]XP_031775269.1 tropomyosin isoforms a/b/d/f [Apis florea]